MKTVIIVSSLVLFSAAYICADNAQIVESYGKIPLAFTVNQGQTDPQVRFTTQGNGCSMLFTPTGTIFYMSRETGDSVAKRNVQKTAKTSGDLEPDNQSGREYESFAFKTVFVGAHSNPDMVGEDRLTWNNNYFIGKDTSKWQTDVPNYGKVRLVEVYDSIDLVYYGDKNRIKYDFVVKSGEDPSTIVLQYYLGENTGNALSINRAGELVVTTPFGDIIEDTPYCYQEINGRKVEVSIRYRIIDASLNIFGFETGNYDTNVDLVIDPALVYSTFLGGNDFDKGTGIAVDSSGNAYVTGYTQSVENYSLPNPFGGLFSNFNINQGDGWGGTFGEGFGKQNSLGSKDIFVAKIKASGNGLAYATFIGGGGWDEANGIALDSSGCVYITGYTESDDYPVTNGAFDTSLFFSSYNVPGTDVFVTKLNAAGNSLAYSTYIGDSGPDYAYAIAVDGSGNAYVTGYTESFQWYLGTSVTNGAYDNTYNFKDAFVTKLNASGTNIVYFTYLGGTGYDTGTGIAVDSSGNAYVTGYTASTNFPVTNGALDISLNSSFDAFVTKVNASGSGLIYSTYLGGSYDERGYGIAIDSSRNAYITGSTWSTDFPVTSQAYGKVNKGGMDVFITKINASGNSLVYSTYLGGEDDDTGTGIAVDSSGNAFITGNTFSSNFPVSNGAFDASNDYIDAFLTKVNASGSGFIYSTFIGGDEEDYGNGITLDSAGNTYLTGNTSSSNYFVTGTSYDTSYNEYGDAFITKFSFTLDPAGTISGIITDSTTGVPISGATVTITPGNKTFTTGSNGSYSFAGLQAPTTYTVTVTANYYYSSTQNISLIPGDTATVNLALNSINNLGTIYGKIANINTGKGITEAIITITPGNYTTTTDTNGSYTVKIPTGTAFTVTASATNYISQSQQNVTVRSRVGTTVNLVLTPLGSITGRITDSSTGAIIPEATITMTPGDNTATTDKSNVYTATTDKIGVYTIKDVPAILQKPYSITVIAANYYSRTVSGVIVAEVKPTIIDITLQHFLYITVNSVSGETGSMINVPVTVSGSDTLYSLLINISFNSADLDLMTVTAGSGVNLQWKLSSTLNTVSITALKGSGFGDSASTICTLKYYIKKGTGSSEIKLMSTSKFYKDDGSNVPITIVNGTINVGTGNQIIGSRGDVNNDTTVDVRDALYVLRMSTKAPITVSGTSYDSPFNDTFIYRGDVNGNGSVQSNDATLILRKVLGINTTLYPMSSAGKTVAQLPLMQLVSDGTDTATDIVFRLSASNIYGIASGDFTFGFDPEILEFVSLNNSPQLENMNFEFNVSDPGILRVGMAQANGIENSPGEMFDLHFRVKNSGNLTQESISINEVLLWNEDSKEIGVSLRNTEIVSNSSIKAFVLNQNTPNPFNPITTINFSVQSEGHIALKVFNVSGQEVTTLINEMMSPGQYQVVWYAAGMPSGVYFYTLKSGKYSESKRMMLLK